MVKLRQKISDGFRSEQSARDFATLRAVIATARKQGWTILETLAHSDPMQLISRRWLRPSRTSKFLTRTGPMCVATGAAHHTTTRREPGNRKWNPHRTWAVTFAVHRSFGKDLRCVTS